MALLYVLLFHQLVSASGPVRCEGLWGQESQPINPTIFSVPPKDFNSPKNAYYLAQNRLLNLIGQAQKANPDPRLNRIETDWLIDDYEHYNPLMNDVSAKTIAETHHEWAPLFAADQRPEFIDRQSLTGDIPPFLVEDQVKMITFPHEGNGRDQSLREIPERYRQKFQTLFRPSHEIPGTTAAEQLAHSAYKNLFHVFRSLLFRPADQRPPDFTEAEINLLMKIYRSGSKISDFRFLAEKDGNFQTDPNSAHRIAVTGNHPGDPIFWNKDLIEDLQRKGQLDLSQMMGLITHELGHHAGIEDTPDRPLDVLGGKIANYVQATSQRKSWQGKNGESYQLVLMKSEFSPRRWRDSFESNGLVLLFFDGQAWVDLTTHLLGAFVLPDLPVLVSLMTWDNFNVEIEKATTGFPAGQQAYVLTMNLQVHLSRFDLDRYNKDHQFDLRTTNTDDQAGIDKYNEFYAHGGMTNPLYSEQKVIAQSLKMSLTVHEDGHQRGLVRDPDPQVGIYGGNRSVELTNKPPRLQNPTVLATQILNADLDVHRMMVVSLTIDHLDSAKVHQIRGRFRSPDWPIIPFIEYTDSILSEAMAFDGGTPAKFRLAIDFQHPPPTHRLALTDLYIIYKDGTHDLVTLPNPLEIDLKFKANSYPWMMITDPVLTPSSNWIQFHVSTVAELKEMLLLGNVYFNRRGQIQEKTGFVTTLLDYKADEKSLFRQVSIRPSQAGGYDIALSLNKPFADNPSIAKIEFNGLFLRNSDFVTTFKPLKNVVLPR